MAGNWNIDVGVDPQFVFAEDVSFDVLISEGERGKERRRDKGGDIYGFALQFAVLTLAEVNSIWSFYVARKGAYDTFLWTNPRDSVQHTVRFRSDKLTREWFTANSHRLRLEFKKI